MQLQQIVCPEFVVEASAKYQYVLMQYSMGLRQTWTVVETVWLDVHLASYAMRVPTVTLASAQLAGHAWQPTVLIAYWTVMRLELIVVGYVKSVLMMKTA